MTTLEGPSHPIHRRLFAEDLVRLRRADEQRRYAAAQRRGRIDPNPHQIDAVVFALGRIPEGGCILADEVGLGKTIEAGLVISQLLAEGMRRVLLIVPKSLQGQWQTELYTLFGIETREGLPDPESFAGSGVFLTHRDLAGGSKGSSILKAVDPFDLVVVDEAHEVFAGVYKRFDKEGNYDDESKQAMTAGRVRDLVKMSGTPVLLLTATPIQNSLTELWGLVQYVEPTGTLLGKLSTFRELFCDGSDRSVLPEQAADLRSRLGTVMQRTLRRQAQDFLEVPFVERQARLIEYSMSPEEKALYDEVTLWLMKPDLCAFRGNQRHLLLIAFHRLMASSLPALSASLNRVAERLREQLVRREANALETRTGAELAADLEEDAADFGDAPVEPPKPSPTMERFREELATVSAFAERCDALPHDSKARCLLDALRVIRERAARGEGTDRVIIFTESLTTQNYLRRLLLENGVAAADITLFRGNNDTAEARAALTRWEEEVGSTLPPGNRPSREVALRLALVYEFRQRSKVFIATEAGGKGLNLQFCDTLINYDLPWNPQKIEQRIGRIHRYGQRRSVTVISFLAKENETQRLIFEILSQKLDLFGKVLGATDAVLHQPSTQTPESLVSSVAMDFEAQLRRIYEHARSLDDVTHELRVLRSSLESKREEFDSEQARTAGLVASRLDDTICQVFRKYVDELPTELAGLDADLERVVVTFLASGDVPFERQESSGRVTLHIGPASTLPDGYREGADVVIGDTRDLADGDALHVSHPLVRAAIEEARRASARRFTLDLAASEALIPEAAARLGGRRGRLIVTKISYRGIEPVDHLLKTAMIAGADEPLDPEAVDALLSLAAVDGEGDSNAPPLDAVEDVVADAILEDQLAAGERERERFERMLVQIDRYVEDQILVLRRRRVAIEERIEEAEKRRERAIVGATRAKDEQTVISLQKEIQRLNERIAILQRGEDADYQAWRDRLFARRFQKPDVERILDVTFTVRNGTGRAC